MIIKDIFSKPIDRDIKGVIKVGQEQDENIKQELEEYVVTRELQKHFSDFFSSYKKGILGTTDKMGVWISGFFGSGKSHFLKIISYILENRMVDGKAAIDYFVADNKISDSMVLADMKLAASTPSTVILFNIDSKSESAGKQNKDAIVSVFLKTFNEKLGFCGAYPYVADLERRLESEGKYDQFKAKFEEINGSAWTEERNAVDFIQDDIVDTLVAIDFMSEEAARNWCEKATEPYTISIDRFAALIKDYLKSKGNNHHIVFLVDEIGQYIGDDSKLMLNLQTVTEDLGTACQGKAWVIVTSQQDIDSITKTKGNDFSKIQGRFDTRLSLSSANVDEVIRKRVLEKNPAGHDMLALLYEDKDTVLKNLILFNDGVEKKLYSDKENFSAVYPFIPYQFNLLGSVLTAIRTYGASGKHLADGERSMLALFKESAMRVQGEEAGALVPFNMFYEPLEEFIDHSHRGVIVRALDNEYLNPNHERDCFDVNVLKVLFMIKYVKEIKANVENITSLMVSNIDDDRIKLKSRVEEALKRLIKQTLVQKSTNDCYVFLTNEEQEINRAVDKQQVEMSEITAYVSELIFDELYDEKKYRFSHLNGRYSYGFNQIVDDKPYKANQNYHLTLKILTPNSEELSDETTLRMLSGQTSSVLVVLPDDRTFIDEIRSAIQIEKFIRFDAVNAVSKYEQIKNDKRVELREHKEQAKLFLEQALRNADIYVNGDKIQPSSKEISSRISEAMGKLAASVFHKNSYIDTPVSEDDIRALLRGDNRQLALDVQKAEINNLAIREMSDYIALNTARHVKTSMKTLMERFMSPPYGFVEADVQWLVAKLFKTGDITVYVNNEAVSLLDKGADEVLRFITRKEYVEKLMTDKRARANEKQKKTVREVMKELFGINSLNDDDDALMKSFMGYVENMKKDLEKYEVMYSSQPAYPGKRIIMSGKALLNDILQMKYPAEFFEGIDAKKDELLDFAEDFITVKKFLSGEQCEIFNKALNLMRIYDDSKTFIVNTELEQIVTDIKAIIKSESPYSQIHKLPELLDKFRKVYGGLLDKEAEPVLKIIEAARKRVFAELKGKKCEDELSDTVVARFAEIKDKADHCNNIATLQNIKIEADALKVRFLNEIEKRENAIAGSDNSGEESAGPDDSVDTPVKVKRTKVISIKEINTEMSWQIETAEDVERYLSDLKAKLIDSLEDNTVISVEF